MSLARLKSVDLDEFLANEPQTVRKLVLRLRRMVLAAAPHAAEDIKFNSLSYYHADVPFGSIGGNICMIEARRGKVVLSFIHGAGLPDPHKLLRGRGKAKRFIPIASEASADDPRVIALVNAAAARPT